MHVIPNTTVTLLRGSGVDEYSGEITNETVAASGLKAAITEQDRVVFDPTTGEPRTIRLITGRVDDGTGARRNDRLYDETKEVYYVIQSVRQHKNPIYTSEEILNLVRVDATDP